MRLNDGDTGNGVKLVPGTFGMNVPNVCTIVIVAGKKQQMIYHDDTNTIPSLGKYLDKVDRVMTQVERITEDISHIPVAAFIFRDKESDEVRYSSDVR